MKKILYSICLFIYLQTNAQDERCFNKGTSAINLGVGIGNNLDYYPNGGFIPIYTGSYEYGAAKAGPGVIGVGVSANYMYISHNDNWGYSTNYTYKTKESYSVLGLRAAYHPDFCSNKKYDIYGAILLNIYGVGYSYTSNNPIYPNKHGFTVYRIMPSLLIGARYYFVPNFGVFGEFGYDFAIIKAGVSFKFGGK